MTFQIALTGINAASTELDTISNNIANNATTGFKRSRAEFADVYATSASSSSGSTVGQGVRVSNIRQEHTQGDMLFTDRNLDIAVEGLGFFQVDDDGTANYTRSGNFGLDDDGYIVDNTGNKLQGYGVGTDAEILPILTDLQIDYSDLQPNRSTEVDLTANLYSNAEVISDTFAVNDASTYNFSTSTLVYDSLGSSEVANIYFQKASSGTPAAEAAAATTDADGNPVAAVEAQEAKGASWNAFTFVGDQNISDGTIELEFDSQGLLSTVNGESKSTFQSLSYTPASGGASDMSLTFDIGNVTQFDDSFGVNKIAQDGYAAGRLEDFDIDETGIIFGRFSNGQAKSMGQVTLSNFANESGLRQVGSTSWTETYDSGEPATGTPGSASLGSLQSGALEGSNVDITQELVSMIGAQRSFQANAQVISTGDTLTQTVINIRR